MPDIVDPYKRHKLPNTETKYCRSVQTSQTPEHRDQVLSIRTHVTNSLTQRPSIIDPYTRHKLPNTEAKYCRSVQTSQTP